MGNHCSVRYVSTDSVNNFKKNILVFKLTAFSNCTGGAVRRRSASSSAGIRTVQSGRFHSSGKPRVLSLQLSVELAVLIRTSVDSPSICKLVPQSILATMWLFTWRFPSTHRARNSVSIPSNETTGLSPSSFPRVLCGKWNRSKF
jgi:hypothetical protein